MYTSVNFKTKKQLKEAVKEGRQIGIFQPGPFGGNEPQNGTVSIEGPHYPQAHTWYARCKVENGIIVSVK